MIARSWRGAVSLSDAENYATYMRETGVREYAATEGNHGVYMLRRSLRDRSEFLLLTLWESIAAIKRFAGEDYERAVFYADDERYLLDREMTASHFEVVAALDRRGGSPPVAGPLAGNVLRRWNGWTTVADAASYETILAEEVLPGIAARGIGGYNGIYVLHRPHDEEVQYTTLMLFESLGAVREFAGEHHEAAYVPPRARAALTRSDETSAHYEVLEP